MAQLVAQFHAWTAGALKLAGGLLRSRHGRGRPESFQGLLHVGRVGWLGQGPVGDVVQIFVDVQQAGQRHYFFAVHEDIGIHLTGGETAGHGHEIFQHEPAVALVHDAVDHVWNGHPFHGIEVHMAANVGHRLEDHAAHRRVLQSEFQDGAHLIGVHAPFDGGHQHGVDALFRQPVQGLQLHVQQVFAPDGLISFPAQAVELEIDHRVLLGQLVQELVVPGDADPVGVDHDLADAPVPGGLNHLHQVGVNGRFSAAELDHFRVAFRLHETVQHGFHLLHGQAEPHSRVGEADGTVQVAGRVDLDQGQADVLLVLGAQAAVQRAAVLDLGAEFQWDGARLVELDRVHVHLGVGTDDALEPAVVRAPFPHVDLVVADDDLGVDHRFALGADAAGQFVEDVVCVLFNPDFFFIRGFDQSALLVVSGARR